MFSFNLLDISEKEYHELPYISYSGIKNFISKGPEGLLPREFSVIRDAMDYGSLVDCLLLEKERFKDEFYVNKVPYPTDSIREVMIAMYEGLRNYRKVKPSVPVSDAHILQYTTDWDKRIKDPTKRLVKLKADGLPYYYALVEANDRIMISTEMYDKALHGVNNIKNHTRFKALVEVSPGVEIYFQPKMLAAINGVTVKVMLDILVIDHNKKIVIPVDLKTGYQHNNWFTTNFWKNKYLIQGALYREVVKKLLRQSELKDYVLYKFHFLYLSSKTNKPTVHVVPLELESAAFNGYTHRDEVFKGIYKYLEEISWHKSHREYDYSKDLVVNKDVTSLVIPASLIPF